MMDTMTQLASLVILFMIFVTGFIVLLASLVHLCYWVIRSVWRLFR